MTSATGTKTVLYYTGNRKSPAFEAKVRETLKENCKGLPVVSVSQKPVDLGRNICVGEVGASYVNVFRQIYIGAQEVETEWIVFAEDDFLYPPDYFEFEPPGGNYYRHSNTWMVIWKGPFYRTYPIGGAQVARRDFVLWELESYLDGFPEWIDDPKHLPGKPDFNDAPFGLFHGNPVVTFKPTNNLSRSGRCLNKIKATSLPGWGDACSLRKQYSFD